MSVHLGSEVVDLGHIRKLRFLLDLAFIDHLGLVYQLSIVLIFFDKTTTFLTTDMSFAV